MDKDEAQPDFVDIVFDGAPGDQPCRFIEIKDSEGDSTHIGEWVQDDNGFWCLRIPCVSRPGQELALLESKDVTLADIIAAVDKWNRDPDDPVPFGTLTLEPGDGVHEAEKGTTD